MFKKPFGVKNPGYSRHVTEDMANHGAEVASGEERPSPDRGGGSGRGC